MPDHALCDDGLLKYLPLSAGWRMGRLQKTGISQKTCQTINIQSFREEKRWIIYDSSLKNSRWYKN
jgi:hypothetical protein